MAGGKGTRLWPESTAKKPKQYLSLVTKNTLLQDTLMRFDGLIEKDFRFVVTVEEQKELALKSCQNLTHASGPIYEPEGRNTAPCILMALAHLQSLGASADDVVVIVPSDHVILNKSGFQQTIASAIEEAQKNSTIVTIGIPPHFPHTGFGYIKKSKAKKGQGIFEVEGFREKPDFELAKEYVQSGEYLWNAGMFVAKVGTFLENFKQHASEMYQYYPQLLEGHKEVYSKLAAISIDYAIMEKSSTMALAMATFDWNDLGSWDALESVVEKQSGNSFLKDNPHYVQNAKGNVVFSPDRFVALIDVDDLVVLSNDKAIAIMPKSSSQKIKDVVEHLKKIEDTKLKNSLL